MANFWRGKIWDWGKVVWSLLVFIVRGFLANRCPMRAAGLAYATLLSLIPALAVVISVTSAFLKTEGEEQIAMFVQKVIERILPAVIVDTNTLSGYWVSPLRPSPFFHSGRLFPDPVISIDPQSSRSEEDLGAGQESKESLIFNFQKSSPSYSKPQGSQETLQTPFEDLTSDQRLLYIRREVSRRIYEFIQNTRSGTLGVTGVLALIFLAIGLLAKVEQAFNDIWGVTRGRSWVTRITNYWATLTLGPLLLAAAIALASGPYFEATRRFLEKIPFAGTLTQFVPLVVIWIAFGLLYLLMPNARVRASAAAVGAIVAGTIWHLMNICSFFFVSRVVMNFKIYGSLGMIPIFMLGVYLSWLDLLLGAQIAYVFQHRGEALNPGAGTSPETMTQRAKEFLALRILTFVGECFVSGRPAPTVNEFVKALSWPASHIRYILQKLIQAGLVVEVAGNPPRYMPARALDKITSYDVLQSVRGDISKAERLIEEPSPVALELKKFVEAERQIATAITIQDLVHKSLGPAMPKTQPFDRSTSDRLQPV